MGALYTSAAWGFLSEENETRRVGISFSNALGARCLVFIIPQLKDVRCTEGISGW